MFNNAPELTIERVNHTRILIALAIAVASLIALIYSVSFFVHQGRRLNCYGMDRLDLDLYLLLAQAL